jgi:tetratricopeptide (TPR) repeat protein
MLAGGSALISSEMINFTVAIDLMKHKTILLIVVMAITSPAIGQKADSLESVLETLNGEAKVKALNELFREHLRNDPVKALGYTQEALNLATSIGDERGKAAAYNNLGVAYRSQGALDKALEYYISSLSIYEKLDDKNGIATTKNNIANIYSIKKDFSSAMRYLEESYNMFKDLKDETKMIGSMNNLGNLYSDMQMYEKAHEYFTEAYNMSEQKGAQYADPLNNLGNIYFKQNNFTQAIDYYKQALEIESKNDNRLGMLNAMANLGIAYTKAKKPKEAEKALEEARKLTTELQAFSMMPSIYKSIAENYFNQGRTKDAYEMQVKYDEEREKMFGEESSRNIAQMEMILDFQSKERELDLLKKESEIQALELRNSRLFIILVIMAVIVVLGLFNLFYLDRKKKLIGS